MREMAIVSTKMVISFFFLVEVSMAGLGEGQLKSIECDVSPQYCGSSGPPIQFPFRLNTQPEDCGYGGFTLSCNRTKTQLQLPNLVKFLVSAIDYESQTIRVSDPDNCFAKQLQQVKSYLPFYVTSVGIKDFALYSCPPERDSTDGHSIPCLSDPGQKVYAFSSYYDITDLPLASCTKMYNLISFPVTPGVDDMLTLSWYTPKCGHCAKKKQKCKLKSGTKTETECFPKRKKGIFFYQISISVLKLFIIFRPTFLDLVKLGL